MTKRNLDFSQASSGGGSPHDFFGRKTIGDPLIAADLLRHYGDSVVREHIDLDNLQAEPTHFFGPSHPLTGAKEVILDVPYVARLRDKAWKGVFSQGIEVGEERGRVAEKINAVQKLLRIRFKQVPDSIVDELNGRTDLIALESLFEVAAQCNSIGEFADALR